MIKLKKLVEIRKILHSIAEVSENEEKTSKLIYEITQQLNPSKIITNLGGHGLAVEFDSGKPGNTVMYRCDIDALPIAEINEFNYKSETPGVGHKCGHDGHTTIGIGIAQHFSKNRPENGRIVILFQASEENGKGAQRVVDDPKFKDIYPDYIIGLHNIPGYPEGTIISREGTFSNASKGNIVKLKGKTSHAAEPDKGITPSFAVADLLTLIPQLPAVIAGNKNTLDLITITYTNIGEKCFGTSPGLAEIYFTSRTTSNEAMEKIDELSKGLIENTCNSYGLEFTIEYDEVFPANVTHTKVWSKLVKTSDKLNYEYIDLDDPFGWSEDFGVFTMEIPGAMFGIGSGEKHPSLHNPDYDFNDNLIEPAIKFSVEVLNDLLSLN